MQKRRGNRSAALSLSCAYFGARSARMAFKMAITETPTSANTASHIVMMVTHDAFTASYCKRILFIKDGKIFNELVRGNDSRKRFFDRIIEVVTLLGGDSTNVF